MEWKNFGEGRDYEYICVDKDCVMDYLIFCDESLSRGQFFSHFYGGALFNYILELIQESDGIKMFRIEESTMPDSARCRWSMPYRHWKFIPAKFK